MTNRILNAALLLAAVLFIYFAVPPLDLALVSVALAVLSIDLALRPVAVDL
jgi:hypothetical protein